MKFHALLHLAQDIEMFGAPMVVDTGSNESHHKTTKIATKLTQKDVKTFEQQRPQIDLMTSRFWNLLWQNLKVVHYGDILMGTWTKSKPNPKRIHHHRRDEVLFDGR